MRKADITRTARRPEPEPVCEHGDVIGDPPEIPLDARRVDRCANHKRRGATDDCPNNAAAGSAYCSEPCVAEARARNAEHFVGGSIARHLLDVEASRPPGERDPILGTRFPRENSRDRSGLT